MNRVVISIEVFPDDLAAAIYRQSVMFEPRHPELAIRLANYLGDGIRQQVGLAQIFDSLGVEPVA